MILDEEKMEYDIICDDKRREVTLTLNTDVLESMFEVTAEDLMKVFQKHSISREEDEKVKVDILFHLNMLKNSLLSAGREQPIAATVENSKPMSLKSTHKTLQPNILLESSAASDKESTSVRKGIKRPDLSTDVSLPRSKVKKVNRDPEESRKELSKSTKQSEVLLQKHPLKGTCTTQSTTENLKKMPSVVTLKKAPSLGYHGAQKKASLDKPRTNPLTTMDTQSFHVNDLHELSGHEASQERKSPIPRVPPAIKAVRGPNRVRRKLKQSNKDGKKRVRRSRCSEKEKHLCPICSQPDCGECKNCL